MLKGLGIEALKYLAGIAVVCAVGFAITVCTSGCAVWTGPASHTVYRERPVHVYRAPIYHRHGRPVVAHKQHPHGKFVAVKGCAKVRTVYKDGRSVTRCIR